MWLFYAFASGSVAALNGLFTKLVTGSVAKVIAQSQNISESYVRAMFMLLTVTGNVLMWYLYTNALSLAPSSKVTVVNTTVNFILTTLAGIYLFKESKELKFWVGAVLLLSGNLLIATRPVSSCKVKSS